MVSVSYDDKEIQLILCPDQSLSWRGNQYLLLVITVWMLCFAFLLASAGFWVVLPFVCLQLLALAAALYYVSRKLSCRQVLEIGHHHVRLSSGRREPEQCHIFPRVGLVVRIIPPKHPWGCPVIKLCGENRHSIRVGEFLNRDDCEQLLRCLKTAHLPTRHNLEVVDVVF